ncbi:hypothetical protein TNCV_3322451 [Trichonephila clavipes]|nr:hypothetical protein TNCV_3322451 [Trichonephila clavipes]
MVFWGCVFFAYAPPVWISTSSSTQVQLFSSASPKIPTIPCESQPPILNSNASTDNSLHTWVPTLPSEDFILPSTSDRVENLSTEISHPSLCLILHLPHPLVNHFFQKL